MSLFRLGFSAVFVVSLVESLSAATPTAEVRAKLVEIDEYLSRVNAEEPIWVKYDVKEYYSPEYFDSVKRVDPSYDPKKDSSECEEVNCVVHGEIARLGDKVRTSHQAPLLFGCKVVPMDKPFVHVFDGERTVRFDNMQAQGDRIQYSISSDPARARQGYASPWHICQYDYVSTIVRDLLIANENVDKAIRKVELSTSAGNGEPGVIRLAVDFSAGYIDTIDFDTSRSYVVTRLTTKWEDGTLARELTDIEYQDVLGQPYPKKAVFRQLNKQGERVRVSELLTLSVITDPKEIPSELFQLEIPKEAAVFDEDLRVEQRDARQISGFLDSISSRRRSQWRLALVIGNIACLLGIVIGVFVWRRRRAK